MTLRGIIRHKKVAVPIFLLSMFHLSVIAGPTIFSKTNLTVAPGVEPSQSFIWTADRKQKKCIIEVQARIQATGVAVGWCNQVLTVMLNGKEVSDSKPDGSPRLLNKPLAIGARSLTVREKYPNNWWQQGGWALFYSESFSSAGANLYRPDGPQPLESEYLPAVGDPYLFDLDVSDLIQPGSTNEIVLRYNRINGKLLSEITGTPAMLIIGRLKIKTGTQEGNGYGIASRAAANPITGGKARLEQAIKENPVRFEVGKDGSIAFFGEKRALGSINSAFSFPNGGYHYFGKPFIQGEACGDWQISVKRRIGPISVIGETSHYRITRKISVHRNRLEIADTIENKTNETLGMIMEHRFEGMDDSPAIYVAGQAGAVEEISGYKAWSNPTLFQLSQQGGIGIVTEDDVLRVQGSLYHRQSVMGVTDANFGLAPRASYTARWSVYMFPEWAGYFDFINEVREDWNVNYKVAGSSAFFCPNDYVPKNNVNKMDEGKVVGWLGNRNANVVLTYAPTDVASAGTTRFIGYSTVMLHFPEYKPLFLEAAAKIRKANPNAKILVYMHTGICGLPDGPKNMPIRW